MRIRASIEPDVAPITEEMVARLWWKPRDRHRSQIEYWTEEFRGKPEERVKEFITFLAAMRENLLEAFGTEYSTYLYLEGDGEPVFLDHHDLGDIASIRGTIQWRSE